MAPLLNFRDFILREIIQAGKEKMLHGTTYMRHLKQSNPLKENVEWLLPEAGCGVSGESLFHMNKV